MIKIKSKRAFTLLEMSIVILIIGILVVGTINFQIAIDTKSKENITADKINRIEKAISEYFLKNGKLPCPSNIKAEKTDSTYGKESRYDGSCSGYEEKFVNNGLIYGGVPTKDLELTDDYSVDAWGSSISYVISKKYGDKKIYLSDNEETIKLQNTKGENITSNAIYILISSGKNKNGAFRNGTQWNTNNSLSDSVNSFSNNFSNIFKKDVRTDNFDDIVVFKEKDLFVIKEDLETLPCTLKDLRELDSNWNYNSFNKCNSNGVCPQGTIIPSQNDCPNNNISKNPSNTETKTKPLRKCLNYGQWSSIIYPCINSCGESNIDSITTNMILSSGILGYSINRNFLKRGKIGEIIELQCLGDKVGYIKLECGDDGNWSYKSGDCYDKEKVAVFCENSQLNSNDKNMVFSTTTGTTESPRGVEGECATGYTKVDDKDVIAICQRDGTWFYTDACSLNGGSITFNYTGSMQTWTIPEYLTSIKIQVLGASGGSNNTLTNNGVELKSGGGCAYGTLNLNDNTLNVKAGDTLYINVGGSGGTTHHGGQATDIRINNTSSLTCNSNDPRIIVAGGGGGTGVSINNTFYKDKIYAGGGGGGSGNGSDGSAFDSGAEGRGGTQSSGGAGGFHNDAGGNYQADSGQCGFGGAAYPHSKNYYGDGGDGWYGGGGASGGGSGGSGGGGSAHFVGLSNTGGLNGARFGNGLARICWGNNTDCDTCQVPQCQNSQLSFTNATFENTAETTNINQTQTGTCNTGYFGSVTAMCTANGWSYIGSCYESGSITFNYTGSQQTWTVPNGVTSLKILAFGAKGGGDNCGYGGYSRGILNVSSGQTIYITVGGSGSCSSSGGSSTAGYNGGGYDGTGGCGNNRGHGCGGGGATHIAKTSGLLKNLSSSNVLLVAGGGGGKSEGTSCGGAGGGANSNGSDGNGEWKGFGGTVSGGGSGNNGNGSGGFGYGGNVTRRSTDSEKWCGGAGGGGYYGGGAGEWAGPKNYSAGGGGGGSGFCGNGMQSCSGSNGYNNGDGMARICWGNNTDCD